MKKLTFPFLKCCEWLYLSALSAGLLFTAYGFLQAELARVIAFADIKSLTAVVAAGAFCAGLIVYLSAEKRFQLWALLGVAALNTAAGVIYMRQSETPSFFWSYLALEAVCFAGTVFVYLVRRSPILKGALVLVQAGGLVALAVLKKPLDAWCVCIMLAAILLYLAELTAEGKSESLGLLPIFALAMLLLCLLPKSEKPLDWSFVKKAYTAVQQQAEMLMVDIAYMIEGESNSPVLFTGYGGAAGQGAEYLTVTAGS